MSYDLDAMRTKVRTQMSGKRSDPDEFKPPKMEGDKEALFRFFILGPYSENDNLRNGAASHGMETFFVPYGIHFGVCNPPQPCPRVCSGEPCPICQHGFDLMKEAGQDKDAKKAISQSWMAANYHVVNIYFPPGNGNPKEYEGRVMYYKASKTCVDKWVDALERTGPGDDMDPQAYGAFFDEQAGFMFQLSCKFKGQNNTYEGSKFLANAGNPMAISSDPAGILQIMAARFDLVQKLQMPDTAALTTMANNLINGVSDDGFSSPAAAAPAVAAAAPAVAAVAAQAAVATAAPAAAPATAAPVAAPAPAPVAAAPAAAPAAPVVPVEAAPVAAAPVAAPAPVAEAPAEVVQAAAPAAPVEAAAAPVEAAATTAAPAAAETVQPPAEGGGADDVMDEIQNMLKGFGS